MGDGTGGVTTHQQQHQASISGRGLNTVPSINPSAVKGRFDDVENYGADPTGEEPINEHLEAAWSDDTLIVLPKGEYKTNRKFRQTTTSNVGLIGQNAVIRHGEVNTIHGHLVLEGGYQGGTMMFRLGTPSNPHGDLLIGGLIFDWGWSENAGMQAINAFVEGEGEIRNIVFNGTHSLGTHGNIRAAAGSPDSVMLVDSVDMAGGGLHFRDTINTRTTRRYGGYTDRLPFGQSWSTQGVVGHPDQEGTSVFRNIVTGPWPGSPIYVRGGSGRKIVSKCIVSNGGSNQIRTNGGNNWEPVEWLDGTADWQEARDGPYGQTTIENCLCGVEEDPEGVYLTQTGILLQDGPQLVRNCEIELGLADGRGGGGTYGVGTRGESGAAPAGPGRVENTTITLHESTDAFYVSPYTASLEVENVAINTVGWEGTRSNLIGGVGPNLLQNVTLNGEPL
ncbi:hypothetical protein [Saliphagus sp. LR7]|uniref:hypothetical protein n=1 Tax=Saliphagus sp. LR7 TaxID=2282654 RepID=UPI001E2C37D1|nr:hypothetical protein [Saliphagus sp. LR7]